MSFIDDKESLFVGKKYPYYHRKWNQPIAYTFNLAAFLFGVGWLAYRKMYLYAWVFAAILLIETWCESIFDAPYALSNTITIAFGITIGFLGNILYKYHVGKKIKEITATVQPEQLETELKKQGGISIWAVIGYVVVIFTIIALAIIFGSNQAR